MKQLLSIIGYSLTIITACGVFLHDGRLDRAFSTSASASIVGGLTTQRLAKSDATSADPHTHPERSQRTLNGFTYRSPSIPPREHKSKKYLLQKLSPRGHHAFDNYNLPIVA